MDLIDEEDVSLFEGSEQTRQVARLVQDGTGCHLHVDPHFIGYDMRQGRLSQTGRTVEQGMVQGLAAHLRSFDVDLQVGDDFALPGKIIQFLGPDYSVQFTIFAVGCAVRVEFAHKSGPVYFSYKYSFYYLIFDDVIIPVNLLKTDWNKLEIIELSALKTVDKQGFPLLETCGKVIRKKSVKLSTVPSTGLSTGFQQLF